MATLIRTGKVHFGSWKDDQGNREYSVSVVFDNQEDADAFAKENKQAAMFDLANQDIIRTNFDPDGTENNSAGGKWKYHPNVGSVNASADT